MTATSTYEALESTKLVSLLVEKDELLEEKEREIQKLQHHLVKANQSLYGKRSEKRLINENSQVGLFEFDPLPEPTLNIDIPAHKRAVKRGRKPLPHNLPREEIIHEPAETHCPKCESELVEIGREVTELLEKVPAKLCVEEHVKIKKGCPCCKEGVYTGKIPDGVQPLERRRPGAGLLADIIVNKYCDHLPLNRQEEIFKRQGALVPKQRMSDWVGEVASMLSPIYEALLGEILSSPYVQADETSVLVQDRSTEKNMVTGWFWAVHKPPNLIYYRYTDSRASEVPKELFKTYKGSVQTDAYVGYDKIYLPDKCQRVACLAHVRRKFVEIEKLASKEAATVLRLIADLYRVEKRIKKLAPEEKLTERQGKSKKILGELYKYLLAWQERTLPKSAVAPAISYALNQWVEIERFTESGAFEIDNNSVERMMRPIAVGRHNWLFAGSHGGARRSAILYSLINSCKLCKVNPYDYLKDLIKSTNSYSNSKIRDLLPHNWKGNSR